MLINKKDKINNMLIYNIIIILTYYIYVKTI